MRAPDRREQLLDVTTQLAVEEGFHAISLEAVARRAGITRAVIYQHFEDLHDLLGAVVRRESARALEQVGQSTVTDLSTGDARERLLASLAAYLQVVRDHPTTWRLVLMPPEGAPESLRRSIAAGREAVLARLARAVQPALAGGDVNDAELTAQLLSAISDQYARLVLTDPARYQPERLLRHARWCLALSALQDRGGA